MQGNTDRPAYYRPLRPYGQRRANWHNYYAPAIYMITVNKAAGIRAFATLADNPPRCVLTETGTDLARNILALSEVFDGVRVLKHVIMPEHVHFVLYINIEGLHPGTVVRHFKRAATRHYHGFDRPRNASDNAKLTLPPVFESGYHDRILTDKGKLNLMLQYIADNPRRRLDRQAHPDCHRRTMLCDEDGTVYEAYGDPNLLYEPDIHAVRISRSFTGQQLRQNKTTWLRATINGGVLASPFISEAERRVRDWSMDNGGRLIIIMDNGFGRNYAPKEPWHTLCTEGRLLLVAPAKHSFSAIKLTRSACMAMNALAASIAAHRLRVLGR